MTQVFFMVQLFKNGILFFLVTVFCIQCSGQYPGTKVQDGDEVSLLLEEVRGDIHEVDENGNVQRVRKNQLIKSDVEYVTVAPLQMHTDDVEQMEVLNRTTGYRYTKKHFVRRAIRLSCKKPRFGEWFKPLYVKNGANILDYDLFRCTKWETRRTDDGDEYEICVDSAIAESGSITVHITCKKTQQATPERRLIKK